MTIGVPAHHTQHLDWLLAITQLPTASGREWRVVDWITKWVAERPDLKLITDSAGNLVVEPIKRWGSGKAPIFITAHLDHPAFVVERIVAPTVLELAFRGGVMDVYFTDARVRIHTGGRNGAPAREITGTLKGVASLPGAMFTTYLCELDESDPATPIDARKFVAVGDVATWNLPPAEIDPNGLVHTHACDDLAALAAALTAFDLLRERANAGKPVEDVRLIFTRSEEIGFTGAIAACRLETMPKNARVIALENSRSFADSPIGGGPIVRVGDRMSIFDPRLTSACAKRAEDISGNAAAPTASQKNIDLKGWKWQRKLMAGGACEATVFCAYGYQATCLCLPLGNYHNMANLTEVQDGTYDTVKHGPPRVGREFIHRDDFFGLVDLLVAIGESLPEGDPAMPRIQKLYDTRAFVLEER
jgi:endoglucanase